jgi:adenosine deaminase
VDYLAAQRIPLEMCPMSNVRTQVVGSLREHPIRQYFDAGIVVTVNTDDPQMFQTSLADEYRLLEECGWTKPALCRLILAAIESAWLPAARKAIMTAAFTKDPAWNA